MTNGGENENGKENEI
jgi:hypothetical protein